MTARNTLSIGSVIVLIICLIVTAALVTSASIFGASLERVRLAHEDLVGHSDLATESYQYMQEALKTLYREGDAGALREAEARVGEAFAAIEKTQHLLQEQEEDDEDSPDAGELDRLLALRKTFTVITKDVGELTTLEHADPSYQRWFVLTFEEEFKRDFIGTIRAAITDEREDLESAMRGSQRLVTWIEIGAVSVTVVALLGLALMLSSLFGSLARAEKLAAVGALAGSIGHELRNPLAAVRNASHYVERRIAKSDLNADERVREFMGIIDKELVACNKIVADLLDYARERPLASGPSPLRPLVADALSIVQPPRPMRVENDVPEGLPVFDLDPDLMRQVIVNLVQNAMEAIPAEREGEVRVTAQVIDETLCVSVTDNGGGIPLGTRRRMFEPLFTTKVKGTGLGLAICAKIVDRHGGAIDVDSTENKGSTVTVRLPRSGRKR